MAKAYLCNKNRPVLTVEIEGGNIIAKGEVIDYDHLPICLQYNLTLESLNKWMKSRLIPEKREGLKVARQRFPGFENYGNMFSLSDQYWFQFHPRKESWEKLNFFTNSYV